MSVAARDRLLHATIVPRPIAWIISMRDDGHINMAPFSFFNLISIDPPLICVGIGKKRSGGLKDTARNILDTKQFVVNLVPYDSRHAMNLTSGQFPDDVDEMALAALHPLASYLVRPPRVAESPVALECELAHSIELAEHSYAFFARVLAMHVCDDAIENPDKPYIRTEALDLIARMHGGGWYARTTSIFQLARPDESVVAKHVQA